MDYNLTESLLYVYANKCRVIPVELTKEMLRFKFHGMSENFFIGIYVYIPIL